MTPFYKVNRIPDPGMTPEALAAATGLDVEKMRASFAVVEKEAEESTYWLNDLYQVVERLLPDDAHGFEDVAVVHLSIKRLDREPIHDWRHLQAIKNAICGEQYEAIELYPAEDRLVDGANQYHLWVFKTEGARIPLGWKDRITTNGVPGTKMKQRPFNLDDMVHDAVRLQRIGYAVVSGAVQDGIIKDPLMLAGRVEDPTWIAPDDLGSTLYFTGESNAERVAKAAQRNSHRDVHVVEVIMRRVSC